VHFDPLRPASRRVLIAGFVFGPLAWIAVLVVTAAVLNYTGTIAFVLAIAAISFVVSIVVLSLTYAARRRQEERHAELR
jgi:heme/copper-type cytochrome/quinol oxidase subunit 4